MRRCASHDAHLERREFGEVGADDADFREVGQVVAADGSKQLGRELADGRSERNGLCDASASHGDERAGLVKGNASRCLGEDSVFAVVDGQAAGAQQCAVARALWRVGDSTRASSNQVR